MPLIGDVVPLYQNRVSFISVRADCQGLSAVARAHSVVKFPTVLILRGGTEKARIEGGENVVGRLMRSLNALITDADRLAHDKRRHYLREKAKENAAIEGDHGTELDAVSESDATTSQDQEWTWDVEQRGEAMKVTAAGLRVFLKDDSFGTYSFPPMWEMKKKRNVEWKELDKSTSAAIEAVYITGEIFRGSRASVSSEQVKEIWVGSDVTISSYEVVGVQGESDEHGEISLRRRGQRVFVPDEDNYVTKEQQQRDQSIKEWNEKANMRIKKLKEEKIGKDIESIKGTISLLPNTGMHSWKLRWNHEPARGGHCDGFGVVSDACETFGPCPSPCLGGKGDQGTSIALYASGEIYHLGKCIAVAEGKRAEEICNLTPADVEPVNITDDVHEKSRTVVPPRANLFGENSIVSCVVDTGADGGTLTILVDGAVIHKPIVGIFEKLGGTELFPAVCMCPLEALDENALRERKLADLKACLTDADESKRMVNDMDITTLSEKELTQLAKELATQSLYPSVSIVLNELPKQEKKGDEADEKQGNEGDAVEGENAKKEEQQQPAKVAEVSVDVERVRWMWESSNGWQVYSATVSRDLEIAQRDGKGEYTVRIGEKCIVCNLDYMSQKVEGEDERKLRRHVLSEGLAGMWEILSLKYEPPLALTGASFIATLEKVWSGHEKMDGRWVYIHASKIMR